MVETFRGPAYASVRYEVVEGSGDSVGFNSKPKIVTLCKNHHGFSSPGPGASFEGEAANITEARRVGKQLASGKSKSLSSCP